ncbi:MAG: tetratricopeptide repeat protein [Rhodospirillaceae bacterium]|nr:tetratricopeptide repeat protein [Rhodospirillaceae bacterium]
MPAIQPRAQTAATGNVLQQFEQAFEHMLLDPANLDKSFKYAELGIQVGDYEAAISALERMLLYNPDLPRVRLELGVLYMRLGSYAIARGYLTRAVQGDDVPDDVRARVAVFLDEIDNRLSNHRFSGSLYGGLRYQDNANAGPERAAIRLFDDDGELSNEFTKKADFNAFMSFNFRHVYDPQVHSGDVLQTDFLLYASQQKNQHQLDLIFSELTVGPRAQLLREYMENATWRPHVIASVVSLDDSPYYYTYGIGFDMDKQFTAKTHGSLTASYVHKKYRADIGRTTARQQNGGEADVEINVRHRALESLMLTTKAGYSNLDAAASLNGNTEFTFAVGAILTHPSPDNIDTGPWTTSLTGTVIYSSYHAPDEAVDSFQKRRDNELRGTLLTSVPLRKGWSATSTVARSVVDSKFLNYTYTNWAISIGASKRF